MSSWIVAVILGMAVASTSFAAQIDVKQLDRDRVLNAADDYLKEEPVTVTAMSSPRSAGGKHDFFSEGDYWWPDPANPDGPYIQKDGMTNPDNFVAHRQTLLRLTLHDPPLAAACVLPEHRRYAGHVDRHLRAWFVDANSRRHP